MKDPKPDVFDEALGMTIEKYGADLVERHDKALREAIKKKVRPLVGGVIPTMEQAIDSAKVEEKEV